MQNRADNLTIELNNVCLALRTDLEFTYQVYGGRPSYLIEDPTTSQFFRIGIAEYTFISLLDGTTSVAEAVQYTATKLGADAFSEVEAARVCQWLIESQLASTDASLEASRLVQRTDHTDRLSRRQWLNPLMLKLPLCSGDTMFAFLNTWLGWIVGWPTAFVLLLLFARSIQLLWVHWNELRSLSSQALVVDNWLSMCLTLVGLRIAHELAHGLVCKRLGGEVRELGLMLILFAPLPYVDVTHSWRFQSKWQRILTSAAGMLCELGIAAIATIICCTSNDPVVRQHAYQVMVAAGLVTLLFNANFLMRFDGYYILADLLEIPNLSSQGTRQLLGLAGYFMLGLPQRSSFSSTRERWIVTWYGAAAFIWRLLVSVSLIIAAESLFFGAGLVLSILAVTLWFIAPLYRFVRYLLGIGSENAVSAERPRIARLAVITAILSLTSTFVLSLPWPFAISAPAIVEYQQPAMVRTETAGFVTSVHVAPGSRVRQNQIIVSLENEELLVERSSLKAAIQQSDLRIRLAHAQEDIPTYQAELEHRRALRTRLGTVESQCDALDVRATATGTLVTDELDALVGRHLSVGHTVGAIVNEESKELVAAVDQRDIVPFEASLDQYVNVATSTRPWEVTHGVLTDVKPRATSEAFDPALTAIAGGPLSVHPLDSQTDTLRLVEPCFAATIQLDPQQSATMYAGQTARIRLTTRRESVGSVLYSSVRDWLRDKLKRSRDSRR